MDGSNMNLCKRLDAEFDQHLADMKPYVLKLTHKSERQRCALWIKKFCEPPGSGVTGRKNRNMYAQLMLIMLRRGALEGPFTQRPDPTPLAPLPTYMSIYFDEPGQGRPAKDVPDWLTDLSLSRSGLLGSIGEPDAASTLRKSGTSRPQYDVGTSGPQYNVGSRPQYDFGTSRPQYDVGTSRPQYSNAIGSSHTRRRTTTGSDQHRDKSPTQYNPYGSKVTFDFKNQFQPDEETADIFKPRSRSPRSPHSPRSRSPRRDIKESPPGAEGDSDWRRPVSSAYLHTSSYRDHEHSLSQMHEKEIGMKTQMLEVKYHEEKLRMQQKHDAAVQKILDRKNSEIEEVKTHYRSKNNDLEDAVKKLEKKVSTLVRESAVIRENKDKQISELKKLAEDSSQSRQNEHEKRLHDAMADFEQEKFDMQKEHTKNIQELLEDTNTRLQKMEHEYSQQTASTTSVIKELEGRLLQLTQDAEKTTGAKQSLEKIRMEQDGRIERLLTEVQDWQSKYSVLDGEHQRCLGEHDHDMRVYRQKTEAEIEYLQQEHSMAGAKAADTMAELDEHVRQLKQQIHEAETHRQRQVRDMEQTQHQDKVQLEHLHDKKVRGLQKELEHSEGDSKKKIKRLEDVIQSKDSEIASIIEQSKQQASQSEQALEQFKGQVEKNSSRMFEEMKKQMEKVEIDLTRSKQLREKQKNEFEKQILEERQKHEHEMAEVKISLEQKKAELLRNYHLEKEAMLSEHDRDMDNVRENLRREVADTDGRAKDRQERDSQTIQEMDDQIRSLREEVVQANQLRKQQLVELGLLRDEERQKLQRDSESQIAKMNSQMEQQRLELQKTHTAEMEKLLEKTNSRLKDIEKEYTIRSQKSTDTMVDLQNTIELLKDERNRSREDSERRVADTLAKKEEEKRSLKKQLSNTTMNLQQETETLKSKVRTLERRLQQQEADSDQKMNEVRYENEQKMKGLMPVSLRNELEDTISSLKSQVNTLQQRVMVLQEELDMKTRLNTSFGARSLSPIKI